MFLPTSQKIHLSRTSLLWLLLLVVVLILCTACQGATPVAATFTSSLTATLSATATLEPSQTPTPLPSLTPIPPTETASPSPTRKPPTLSPTPAATATLQLTPTAFPTATFTPSTGRRPTPTASATLNWPFRKRTPTDLPTETYTPSLTPTITLTPEPYLANFRISIPGNMSKVLSPFKLQAVVDPGDDGLVILDLLGEDNSSILHQLLKVQRGWIAPMLEFKITAVSELARLVLSSQDSFGRKIGLTSVDLVLLSFGDSEIKPADSDLQPYVIWSPKSGESISGGTVTVTGLARPVNDSPVIFELIDEQGNVVGQIKKDIAVPDKASGQTHTPYEVNIPYSVTQSTNVRLTIRQESTGRIPGTVELNSRTITIEP